MKYFSYVLLLVFFSASSDVFAQVSAPQLENLHRNLEELKARNKILEAVAESERIKNEEQRLRFAEDVDRLRTDLENSNKRYVEYREFVDDKHHMLMTQMQGLEAINRHLRNLVQNDRNADLDQIADGRIVSVAHDLKTVEIDLGHADAAFVGLQLDVLFPYELIDGEPSDSEIAFSLLLQERCQIEVISIDSKNQSTAKVLPDSNTKSLQVGAIVATPLWERRQRHNVVFLEEIDNADLIQQTLWEAGLESNNLSNNLDELQSINAQTRYVVVADFDRMLENDNEKVRRDYVNAIAMTNTFAIPVLDRKRLLMQHPIPESDSEQALQLMERFQQRRIEEIQKRIEQGLAEEEEKSTTENPKTNETPPEIESLSDPFAN